jgi:DNA-binding transcriptional LysR family regulator
MEAVIALSETLNFRRAAKILNISQPTLTRYINGAEKAAGVPLFERDHQTVKPLDSCWAYVEEARTALLHSRRCAQAAQAAHQNAEVVIHVGKSPYADPFYISTLRTIQLPLHRNLRMEEFSQFSCDLAHEVLSGSVDVAIVTEPPESPHLSTVKIGESSFYIAMSEDDELAGQPSCLGLVRAPDAPDHLRRRRATGAGTQGASSEDAPCHDSGGGISTDFGRVLRSLRGQVRSSANRTRRRYHSAACRRRALHENLSSISGREQVKGGERTGALLHDKAIDFQQDSPEVASHVRLNASALLDRISLNDRDVGRSRPVANGAHNHARTSLHLADVF